MLFDIVEFVVVSLMCWAASIHYVHVLQINRYQIPAYRHWVAQSRERVLRENVLWAFICALLSLSLPVLLSMFINGAIARAIISDWLALAIFAGITLRIALRDYHEPSKKPFVYTRRIRRLSAILMLECILCSVVLTIIRIPLYFLLAALPYLVHLAALIIEPYENRLNASFFKSARQKIRQNKKLITIGITGSYGKTNVKFILRELLSSKYKVLATPASFNTAMGISRVVNDQLSNAHEVFIAEMGATHVGDIKELVDLVRPKYGILTNIGARHLDSFGSLANIASTKFELIQGLPKDGIAVFGSGDDYINRLYAKCEGEKYRVSLDAAVPAFMTAQIVNYSPKGTTFIMECEDGTKAKCRTRLLGSYNVQNILLASTLARKMGMEMSEITDGIRRLQPIEHHLQLIISDEITKIDDSYNEDADGAFEAMKVLAQMPGHRIVLTPGLEDSGNKELDVNFALGTVIADSADDVIVVGYRSSQNGIIRGLMQSGFSQAHLHTAADMEDAEAILKEIVRDGDTVLFENRIMDYEEA